MVLWLITCLLFFFFSSRRRHTRSTRDWSSDVCSSDLLEAGYCPPFCRSPTIKSMSEFPEQVVNIARVVRAEGGRALLVGGCVRDALMEIGRASCRERGGMSGVGGAVRNRTVKSV